MPPHHSFSANLEKKQEENDSFLMVGLDSDLAKIPDIFKEEDYSQFAFNKMVIDATKDVACSYKLQMAFYEKQGLEGYESLVKTLSYIPSDIPVVADAKRNDIGNTCRAYAHAFFQELGFDGITLNPYLGFETMVPFLYETHNDDEGLWKNPFENKAVFILAKTSNPGSGDIQNIIIDSTETHSTTPIYLHLTTLFLKRYAELKLEMKEKHDIKLAEMGFVAGATYPEELKKIREYVGDDTLLLIPGIGAQGGDVKRTIQYGTNSKGRGVLINSSRGIIFPDPGNKEEKDVDVIEERIREAAVRLKEKLNRWR